MNKFCSNCGQPLDSNEKFCSHCGQKVRVNVSNQNVPKINDKKLQNSRTINKFTIGIIIFMVFAIGCSVFVFRHFQMNQDTQITVNKMSKRKLAGLAVEYAHLNYRDNKAWNQAYKEAINGNIHVDKYKKYVNGTTTISAKNGNYVYVINKKAIFTTDDDSQNNKADITLADGRRELGKVKTVDAYNEVKNKNCLNELNEINKENVSNK
ncbi:zinc-ribbon domain-containing protein [Lactobacillus kalixensis]|uniref:Zinc-ribbon domain-containing protein n=1 Tax=Lactobacillus kalixensis DSM 16043 TaxID=1423763 RepID=A0A0R1U9C6_9LACO|nr:zinc ribbon domain-containing protein [Lactobacillus kalixensis]KRL89694.1 hypothetical protein FC46_GL000597 [Lactobacillus kalixensis DSM 16043]